MSESTRIVLSGIGVELRLAGCAHKKTVFATKRANTVQIGAGSLPDHNEEATALTVNLQQNFLAVAAYGLFQLFN